MFDARIRPWIDPPLDRVASGLARMRLTANAVTVGGFLVGAGACVSLAFREYTLALILIAVNRVADGLDGAIARKTGLTDFGGYLDLVLDYLFYAGVPFGFAVGRPEFALPAAFLLFSFIGTGASFLGFAAMAAKRGLTTDRRGRKSIYYLGGLAEGTETIAAFVLICLWPDRFDWIAWTFGGICCLTVVTRIAEVAALLRTEEPSS